MLKRIFLALNLLLSLAVAGVWIASIHRPYSWDFARAQYRYHLENHAGALSLETFKNIAEDDFYQHIRVPYWAIEAVTAGIGLALAWWIWRDRRQKQARGFPVQRPDPAPHHPAAPPHQFPAKP